MTERYANAFTEEPDRCFRFVTAERARGQPLACPGAVVARGRWKDGAGRYRVVEACQAHAFELETSAETAR